MDDLTIALSISIGSGVPWLIAIYSDSGARQLISNSVFGLLGAALVALAFDRLFSTYSVIALVSAGPVLVYLFILAAQAMKRAIASKLSSTRQ